ncbi:MAG: hypothetical protein R3A12_02130 [Ignavibacteria bacterium]
MKIVKLFTLTFIFNILISFNIRSQGFNENSESTIQFIDSLANAQYPATEPGLTLLISRNGIPLFVKSYGLSDILSSIRSLKIMFLQLEACQSSLQLEFFCLQMKPN